MVEVPKLVSELDPPSLFMLSTMVLVALVMVVKKTNLMQLVVLCLLHFMLMTLSNHLHSVVMVSAEGQLDQQHSSLSCNPPPVFLTMFIYYLFAT